MMAVAILAAILLLWIAFDCNARRFEAKKARKPRTRRHIPVQLFPQETAYSCTASVLTTLVHSFTGEVISHEQAIRATRCRPDGAPLENLAKALKRSCRTRSMPLRSLAAARRALQAGRLVVSHDTVTYRPDDHAIILAGATGKGFYVADSNYPRVRWRREQSVKRSATEFFAVYPPGTTKGSRKRQKRAVKALKREK